MKNKRGDGIVGGLVFILIGGLFLASNLGLIQLRWEIIWPILLIFLGVVLVLRSFMSGNERKM